MDNRSSYSLILTRENLKVEHLRTIAEGLNLDYDDLAARVQRYTSRPKYDPIIIKEDLTPAEPGVRRIAPRFLSRRWN